MIFMPNYSVVCADVAKTDDENSSYYPLLPLQNFEALQDDSESREDETSFLDLRIVEKEGKEVTMKQGKEERTAHPDKWKQNIRKFNKNHGRVI